MIGPHRLCPLLAGVEFAVDHTGGIFGWEPVVGLGRNRLGSKRPGSNTNGYHIYLEYRVFFIIPDYTNVNNLAPSEVILTNLVSINSLKFGI